MMITLQEEIGPNQAMILVDHPEETSLDDALDGDLSVYALVMYPEA